MSKQELSKVDLLAGIAGVRPEFTERVMLKELIERLRELDLDPENRFLVSEALEAVMNVAWELGSSNLGLLLTHGVLLMVLALQTGGREDYLVFAIDALEELERLAKAAKSADTLLTLAKVEQVLAVVQSIIYGEEEDEFDGSAELLAHARRTRKTKTRKTKTRKTAKKGH